MGVLVQVDLGNLFASHRIHLSAQTITMVCESCLVVLLLFYFSFKQMLFCCCCLDKFGIEFSPAQWTKHSVAVVV